MSLMKMEESETIIEDRLDGKKRNCTGRIADFDKLCRKPDQPAVAAVDRVKGCCRKCCTKRKCIRALGVSFPFIRNIRTYKIRKDIGNDIIAGLTVGVVVIPQGMAYCTLSTLPPIVGLYISFFSALTYFFLGTSRHVSMGCIAIVSLMMGSVLDVEFPSDVTEVTSGSNAHNITQNITATVVSPVEDINSLEAMREKIQFASALSLVSGIIMIVLGQFGLGFITTYMPAMLLGGFTCGASVHVGTSQVKHILGIKVRRLNGAFKVIKTWIEIFKNIGNTNYLPFVITFVAVVILYLVKVQVNQRFKKKLKIPIPIELIVVIIGTIMTHFGKLDVTVVGDIPAGFPEFYIPNPMVGIKYIKDAFVLGIVAFTNSVSMAKILATKNNYEVNANQEMVANGAGSVVCSLFSGFIPAASVSRSLVQEAAGGRTQVTSVFSMGVILVVILAIGPLFYSLPKCILSAVILISLRGNVLQIFDLPDLWRKSRMDFAIWSVTFLSVVLIDADIGIGIGIIFSILTVALRTQRPESHRLGYVNDTNIMKSYENYEMVQDHCNVRTIQYHAPIYFANAELFVKTVYKKSGMNPERIRKEMKLSRGDAQVKIEGDGLNNGDVEKECLNLTDPKTSDHKSQKLLLDFSGVNFVDLAGIKALQTIYSEYEGIGVKVFIAECNDNVISIMRSSGFLEKKSDSIFVTVPSAIHFLSTEEPS